jgi:hypothetical protein
MKLSTAQINQMQADLEAANKKIAELEAAKAKKASRKAKAEKALVFGVKKIQNGDYIGAELTLHTTAQVLAYRDKLSDVLNVEEKPIYIKVSGRVQIDGNYNELKNLTPVVVDENGTFTIYNSQNLLTPVSDTWDVVRVVSMRKSAVERYYIGNGKATKKVTVEADSEESDTEE